MGLFDALVSVAGTLTAQKANNQAVNTANQANQQGLQSEIDAVNQYIAANYEGLQVQTANTNRGYADQVAGLDNVYADAAPGLRFIQQVIANPQRLTDAQRYQLDEARRVSGDQVKAGGFGGSGRTAAAMIGQVNDGMVRGFMEDNRNAAMAAAMPLANAALNAQAGKANASVDQASRLNSLTGEYVSRYGNAVTGIGKATADTTRQAGQNVASGIQANARLTGQAIGDVSAAITKENSEGSFAKRMSRYGA